MNTIVMVRGTTTVQSETGQTWHLTGSIKRAPGSEDDELEANGPQVFHDVGAVL